MTMQLRPPAQGQAEASRTLLSDQGLDPRVLIVNQFPGSPDFPGSPQFPGSPDLPGSSQFPGSSDFPGSATGLPQTPWSSQQPTFGGPRRFGTTRLPTGGIVALIAAVVAIGIVIAAIIAANVHSAMNVSHKGPCVGGPAPGATGQPVGNGNYRFPCMGGGSTVVHLGN